MKTVVLDVVEARVLYADSLEYDHALASYGTRGGVLPTEHPTERHTSPTMLIDALDGAFARLGDSGIETARVGAVKIDAMQHCTVYAASSFRARIEALDTTRTLSPQLEPSLTRKTSPIWEDRSPVEEVTYLDSTLRSHGTINALTGNRAELRFPAAQILKWARQSPDEYSRTAHIFLLSAFLTSLLAGRIAPVDTGDGWGTNLNALDMDSPGWSEPVLRVAEDYLVQPHMEPSLRSKLGEMVPYDSLIGEISPYFAQKYGINARAVVLAGTGDNPATLLGSGSDRVVSLGSSYTVNGVIEKIVPSPLGEYNLFGYTPAKAMALAVFTNGAKVHEAFLERYLEHGRHQAIDDEDWARYSLASGNTILSEDEKLMLPYLMDESVPLRSSGIVREGFDECDPAVNIRALHVSQALSMKLHSGHLRDGGQLCVVGGGARNSFLRQLIADVFGVGTYSLHHADLAASLGSAISGARALLGITYEEAARRFVQVDNTSFVDPIQRNRGAIPALLGRYEALESGTAEQPRNRAGDTR